MEYVILRTNSQKDGEAYSIVTRTKAETIIQHAGNSTAEILATIKQDIKAILKENNFEKPPMELAIDIITNEFAVAMIALNNAKDLPGMRKRFERAAGLRNILEMVGKLPPME